MAFAFSASGNRAELTDAHTSILMQGSSGLCDYVIDGVPTNMSMSNKYTRALIASWGVLDVPTFGNGAEDLNDVYSTLSSTLFA